jgi:CRISPR system Cascade subunit CasD
MANTLFLRLEGAMQSWGERAQWSMRDTAPEPTKSGIVGLLGCALGISSDEELGDLSQSIQIGVRCDLPGTLMSDYHTVVGGVMSAEGKIKMTAATKEPETVVSIRQYLCDASFLVAIRGNSGLIDQLKAALQAPVWPYFLGRKSCPPASPVYTGIGDHPSLEEALQNFKMPDRHSGKQVRAVIECSPSDGTRRKDELVSRKHRIFRSRYTRDVLLDYSAQEDPI